MGAWDVGIFDNDSAGDWACDLEDSDFSFIRGTIESVLEAADDYIEIDVGNMGLAACEVIARLSGEPGPESEDGMTAPALDRVNAWIKKNPQDVDGELIESCLRVIDAVKGSSSEAAELWEESESNEQWLEVVEELRSRLAN